ncbi:MAG: prepilin-type N-terminal cleavage/methylation domain-containing protein [Planctomycetota bacterium]|jgi:prepilin-type N-terminal cleavage/methylation domain-containing protein
MRLPPSPAGRSRGYTLVELLVVIGIIAMLTTMLTVGIIAVKRYRAIVEARLAMDNMQLGVTSLRQAQDWGQGTPLGVLVGARVAAGSNDLVHDGRDFAADGVSAGDRVFILGGAGALSREVTAVAGPTLTVDGASFTKSERDLEYFLILASGEPLPRVHPVRELDPANKAWASEFTPLVNHRKKRYFDCPADDVRDGWFRDPWGNPYACEPAPRGKVVVERLFSRGPDGKPGTPDDIERVLSEISLAP